MQFLATFVQLSFLLRITDEVAIVIWSGNRGHILIWVSLSGHHAVGVLVGVVSGTVNRTHV